MEKNLFYIAELLSKKFQQGLTPEEDRIISEWLQANPKNEKFLEQLKTKAKVGIDVSFFDSLDSKKAWTHIAQRKKKKTVQLIFRIAAVFAVIFSCAAIFYFYRNIPTNERYVKSADTRFQNDVLPASLGARLIRSDGELIGVKDKISILADGRIVDPANQLLMQTVMDSSIKPNILVVPAANYFHLTLADGTKVWVNANSELQFPSKFGATERRVKLKGEAYFEVAKDAARPFFVESGQAEIRVLGTHFNVSAYGDHPITSLEEGKVQVSNAENIETLHPGQKAVVGENRITLAQADLHKELAWKNNSFYFKKDNIVKIAEQLQNWYDLEISFSKGISFSKTYTGEIPRSVNLSQVLKMLEFVSDLEFKLDKNKLLILKRQAM